MYTLPSAIALALILSTTTSPASAAEPLLQYRSKSDVSLPPLSERKVLGTWKVASVVLAVECTRSFEQVAAKFYDVLRCSDGSGGNDGVLLTRAGASKFLSTANAGDYYVILQSGDLSVRDRQGEVDVLPKHAGLQNTAASVTHATLPAAPIEDRKTVGLDCFTVGYRFGFTGTRAAHGKSTNPAWDFATPARCKSDGQVALGIKAGTKAAW